MKALPTGWLTLQQKSDACERFGLDPFEDFEMGMIPLDRCPDAERVRVTKWATRMGGPVPLTTRAFRIRGHLRQTSLALVPSTPCPPSSPTSPSPRSTSPSSATPTAERSTA